MVGACHTDGGEEITEAGSGSKIFKKIGRDIDQKKGERIMVEGCYT